MPHIMQSAGAGRAGRVSTLVDSCLIGDSIVTSDEGAGPGGAQPKSRSASVRLGPANGRESLLAAPEPLDGHRWLAAYELSLTQANYAVCLSLELRSGGCSLPFEGRAGPFGSAQR